PMRLCDEPHSWPAIVTRASCPQLRLVRLSPKWPMRHPHGQGPTHDQTSAALSIRRVSILSRNVGQPDHILANPIISHKAERRSGSGEIWLAVTKHDGVQVDSILIDQAKFGEALRQGRAGNFDLPVALGLQLADRALKIILNKPGVGADRLQRARDDPFRLVP